MVAEAEKPSENGSHGGSPGEGRDKNGRFAPGWKGGGNPYANKAAAWRAAFTAAVSSADVKAVTQSLVKAAREGQEWAVRELLNRTIGKPPSADGETDAAMVIEVRYVNRHENSPGRS